MSDALDNLKFAYALSEARIKQLEARVTELEDKLTVYKNNEPDLTLESPEKNYYAN